MYADEWIRVDGIWLHYQDWPAAGSPHAETALLLHGLTQQSHTFDAIAAHLVPRLRCVALDLRGRGESGWAPGTYAVPRYVRDVLAVLDALALGAVHVVGTSLGGLVGLSLAATAPDRLRSLVLNDIGPDIDPKGAARVAAYAASVPERFAELDAAVDWAVARYPWLAGVPRDAVTESVRWTVRRDPDGSWRLKLDPAIGRAPPPAPEAADAARRAWWAALEALHCPILLVRGAESDLLAPETAALMAARQPRLSRVDVPGVGHAPTLAEPVVRAALERFYGAVAAGPDTRSSPATPS
jgi:pimeloyl-ACP methyl ester carboxylesterase